MYICILHLQLLSIGRPFTYDSYNINDRDSNKYPVHLNSKASDRLKLLNAFTETAGMLVLILVKLILSAQKQIIFRSNVCT